MNHATIARVPLAHELFFRSLFSFGRGYAFPCDAGGRVDLNRLSERARSNYLYARKMIGRELSMPQVVAREPGRT
jgi:hypothetical protein